MRTFERTLLRIACCILRLGIPMILLSLLYTCLYIYFCAPDGGVLTSFRQTAAELLNHALASLGLLIAASAIPDIKLL